VNIVRIIIATLLFCCLGAPAWACKQTAERLFYTAEFDSLYLEGLCYMQTDSLALAEERLKACAKLQPQSAAVSYQLATLAALQKDTVACIHLLKKAVKHGSDNYFYHTALAEMYVEQGDYKQAAKTYQTITKKFPDKDMPLYTLSRCYYEIGDYANSIATYQLLEKRIGVTAEMSIEKAFVMALDGNWAGIEAEFDKLHQKFPLNDDLYFREGALYQSFKPTQLPLAIERYEKALALNPENANALRYLCDLYERTGNQTKMEEILSLIFSSKSFEWEEKQKLLSASYKYYQGRPDFAQIIQGIYQKMLLADNGNEEIWSLYTDFFLETQQFDEAKMALKSCIGILPSCETCHLQLLALSEYMDSTQVYEQTIEQAMLHLPDHPYVLGAKANLLYQQKKNWQPVAKQAVAAITDSTKKEIALLTCNQMGYLFGEVNQNAEAAQCLAKAYALDSTNILTANNYAFYLALAEIELDKAAAISEQTILKDPLNSMYLHTYAYILMKQNKLTHAEFYMEQAVQYDNQKTHVIYHDYGTLLQRIGKTEKAAEMFKLAKEIQKKQEDEKLIEKD
jgi:Tfp pilus assembly protein PilF